jgi:hypothetical protein
LEQNKQTVFKEAGGYDAKTGQLVNNDNIDIATRIFVEQNNGKKLKEEILKTRRELLDLSRKMTAIPYQPAFLSI